VQTVIGTVRVMGVVEFSGARCRHPICAACEFVDRACRDGGWRSHPGLSLWSEHASMAGGDPTRVSRSVKYKLHSGKRLTLAARPELSLAVYVHDTILPLFFPNSGKTLIVHDFRLTTCTVPGATCGYIFSSLIEEVCHQEQEHRICGTPRKKSPSLTSLSF
jgi:hypothetical protein